MFVTGKTYQYKDVLFLAEEREVSFMWSRTELKMRGKMAFKRNYWSAVLVAFVMTLAAGASTSSASNSLRNETNNGSYGEYGSYSATMTVAAIIVAAVAGIIGIAMVIFKIFIGNALLVGGSRYFILNQTEPATAGTLGYVFKSGNFGNVVLTMFLRDLFTTLWTMLFVVPGIIKHYEYLMVPYILAENPGMNRKEAFLISKKMMMGQKWDTFVMDVSFIGWRFLEGITLGIVGIFFVEPYYQATFAELYSFNRALAYQSGYIR